MDIFKNLNNDHILILEKVDQFEAANNANSHTMDSVKQMITFIQEFADQYHHGREEKILFLELEKEGVLTHCNPVQQMLHEHQSGREFVETASRAASNNELDQAIAALMNYCDLMKMHIYKEDNILFPMAKDGLQSENLNTITAKLKDFESSDLHSLGAKYYNSNLQNA